MNIRSLACMVIFASSAQALGNTEFLKLAAQYLPEAPVILDAGAYDGKEIHEFFRWWPNCTVHAFEPVPENFKKLTKTTQAFKNVYRYTCALGDSTGEVTMHVSTEPENPDTPSMSSSLLAPLEHLKYSETLFPYQIKVPCTTLDTWAKENNIDHVDFLWLDLQGYELPALKAATNLLKSVQVILTEIELVEAYKGQALYPEIKQWLEEQGFTMVALHFAPTAPAYWFGDALFVRK